jgi:aminobenzoyl-glutamate transport protein
MSVLNCEDHKKIYGRDLQLMKRVKKFFKKTNSMFFKCLDCVEVVGNKLPHPATLFGLLALSIVIISWIAKIYNFEAIHPVSGALVTANNLMSAEGFRWIYTHVTQNLVEFPPLGLVFVVMIGIGVAEGSGLLTAVIRGLVLSAPKQLVTIALVASGVLSHSASDASYIILIPLGAMIFHALGRHPMAGLAAAFGGISAGFGANFLISTVDPVLAGISTSSAQILDPNIIINPAANFYFMFISAVMITLAGTWVVEKIIEPRLGKYKGNAEQLEVKELSKKEKRALKLAGLGVLVTVIFFAITIIPNDGILRDPMNASVLHSPFLKGIIVAMLIFFLVPGMIYGVMTGTIKNDKDTMKHITKSMSGLAGYIVLVFFAAQFVAFFKHSNLGIIFAIKGAEVLKAVNLTGVILIVAFVLLSATVNMFMGSASAKWVIMAPVFVPMFMLLGYHPALTQVAFRIGDSITNVITPMMSYFALIVTYAQKYDDNYGVGTIVSTMVPFTIVFGILWTILLIVWMQIGLPLGPDGPLYLINSIVGK